MELYVRYQQVPEMMRMRTATAATWVFWTGSILAMLLYPGYNLAEQYLSRLGAHRRSALVFNTTLILTAALLVPSYIAMFYGLSGHMNRRGIVLLNLGIATGMMSAIYLALVGVVPDVGDKRTAHREVAVNFFVLAAVSLSLLTMAVMSSNNTSLLPFQGDYLGFGFLLLVFLMADFTTWYHKILQKVFVYGSLLFLSYLTTRIKHLSTEKEFFYHREKFTKAEVYSLDQALINSRIIF